MTTMVAPKTGRKLVDELGVRLFDADNHYYESTDCFTRHLPPDIGKRAFRWATVDGDQPRLLVNGRSLRMIVNPTFDPLARPGGMSVMFRNQGEVDQRAASEAVDRLAERPEYQDRDARLAVMDEQLVEKNWMFPTLGVTVEEYFRDDPELTSMVVSSFNRWLHEDWGFAYKDRIHAVPMISLADVDGAVRELEWVMERGARLVNLRSCPVPGGAHGRSIADPKFDPFWARVNEARIVVAFHAGDNGGYRHFSADWGENPNPTPTVTSRFQMMQGYRSAYDTAAALLLHGLFDRFPDLRCIFVEQGALWTEFFLKNLNKTRRRRDRARLSTQLDPLESFHKHLWFEPYPEEDLSKTVDLLGEDRVVFGSDWPHVEGTTEPAAFFDVVDDLPAPVLSKIMRDNAEALMRP